MKKIVSYRKSSYYTPWISRRGRIVIVIKVMKVIRQKSSWASLQGQNQVLIPNWKLVWCDEGGGWEMGQYLGNLGVNLCSPDSIYLLYLRTSARFPTLGTYLLYLYREVNQRTV